MMQHVTPQKLMEVLRSNGAFETEEFGFAQEMALQFGFEYADEDCTVMQCTPEQLFGLMKALGYVHVSRVHYPLVIIGIGG